MQYFQGFDQRIQTIHFDHTALLQKSRGSGGVAGKCGCMRAGGLLRCGCFAGLDGDNIFAILAGGICHFGKFAGVMNALNIQPGGGDSRIRQQRCCHICEAGLRLIADTADIPDRQTTRLHTQIDRNI